MIYSINHDKVGLYAINLDWVFAHGTLEEFLEYDCVKTDSLMVFHHYLKVDKGELPYAIIEDSAENQFGEIVRVKIFLWKTQIMRGFIVNIRDEEAIKHAQEKFDERSTML